MHRWWYRCLTRAGVVAEGTTSGKKMHGARYTAGTEFYLATGDIYATQQRLSDAREAWLHALELDPTNLKLMDRFREQGMGDPAQEERIQQAKRRVAGQKPSLPIAQ